MCQESSACMSMGRTSVDCAVCGQGVGRDRMGVLAQRSRVGAASELPDELGLLRLKLLLGEDPTIPKPGNGGELVDGAGAGAWARLRGRVRRRCVLRVQQRDIILVLVLPRPRATTDHCVGVDVVHRLRELDHWLLDHRLVADGDDAPGVQRVAEGVDEVRVSELAHTRDQHRHPCPHDHVLGLACVPVNATGGADGVHQRLDPKRQDRRRERQDDSEERVGNADTAVAAAQPPEPHKRAEPDHRRGSDGRPPRLQPRVALGLGNADAHIITIAHRAPFGDETSGNVLVALRIIGIIAADDRPAPDIDVDLDRCAHRRHRSSVVRPHQHKRRQDVGDDKCECKAPPQVPIRPDPRRRLRVPHGRAPRLRRHWHHHCG
eukprot:m.185808 g.185808  ORF g.185808 m.185808 type:complete len:377 (-) comp24747_c3_seq1:611-1741(-)